MFGWRQANCIENTKENVGYYILNRIDDEVDWEIVQIGMDADCQLVWMDKYESSEPSLRVLVTIDTLDDEVYLFGPIPSVDAFMKEEK